MTLREQVLAAVRGEKTDRVPFTCYVGLLPEGGREIDNLALVTSAPVLTAEAEGVVQSSEEVAPGIVEGCMETPWGTLSHAARTELGYGSSWTTEHWIKTPEDYCVIEQVIRHTKMTPTAEAHRQASAEVGDRGVVLASMNRAPIQRLWIEYTGIERLSMDLMDCPGAVEGVLDAMSEQSREAARIMAESDADLVWLPDNITGEMTGPPLFTRYLAPYYREICDVLVPAGKTPCAHMDGMLAGIADCISETDLPVMEAFTPPPDGNFSVQAARDRWPDKALWLNFPSSVHLSTPEEIERVTEGLVAEGGECGGFLIGVTENMPTSVGTRSLEAIAGAIA